MKKFFLLGIMVCLAMVANAQRSMDWYSYWGSNVAGSQIAPKRVVVDNSGNIYVAANYGGDKVAIESETLVSNSAVDKGDAVIVKMSPAKEVLWIYPMVSEGTANIADMAIDGYGNLFVTGAFNGALKVGNKEMEVDDTNMAEAAVYVLKLRPDGSAVRAWQIASLGAQAGAIAIDARNNVIIAGTLDGDATFTWQGESEGDFQNNNQLFLAKYLNDGTPVWHHFTNEAGTAFGKASLAVDQNENIYLASTLTGQTTIKNDKLIAEASNAFMVCYNSNGEEQWYHMIYGDYADEAAAIAYSPIGQVILAVNHRSGDLYVNDMDEEFNNGYAFSSSYTHAAFFSFDVNGNFKWFYDWGYSNGDEGSDAPCYSLRCTDEGVLYATGMMTGRLGGSRLPSEIRTLPGGKNSGVETIDHQWMQHNTNGGHDCYMITLTRDGKLANVIRPGGPQYEDGMDIALSPDKKSLYLLIEMNVRNQPPYTCPDNIFDSWSDLDGKRNKNYKVVNVFCPENDGSSTAYTGAYKGKFVSAMLVKYAMPEVNPNVLPYFTPGEVYSQELSILNPQGKVTLYPLEKYADVWFENNTVSGNFGNENDRYIGILAIDSTALPGEINYYEYDQTTHRSIRSNPRNLRYFALTVAQDAPIDEQDPDQPAQPVIPGEQQEGIDNIQASSVSGQKIMVDGILYIERNGHLYNAQGAQVK